MAVDSPEPVNALYGKAIELGGRDAGEPDFRTDNCYGCYFRDLDGNKLNFCCIKRE